MGLWSEAGFLAPGPTLRAFPTRRAARSVAARTKRAAAGIPGHSGGSAPDSHRLPFPPTLWTPGYYPMIHGSAPREDQPSVDGRNSHPRRAGAGPTLELFIRSANHLTAGK
jgi:hypothetical protein